MTLLPNTRIQQPGFSTNNSTGQQLASPPMVPGQQMEPVAAPLIQPPVEEEEDEEGVSLETFNSWQQEAAMHEQTAQLEQDLEAGVSMEKVEGTTPPTEYRKLLKQSGNVPDDSPKFFGELPTSFVEDVDQSKLYWENTKRAYGDNHPETKEAWLDYSALLRNKQWTQDEYDKAFKKWDQSGLSAEEYHLQKIKEHHEDLPGGSLLKWTPTRMLHDLIMTTGHSPLTFWHRIRGNDDVANDYVRSINEYKMALAVEDRDSMMGAGITTPLRDVTSSIGSGILYAGAAGGIATGVGAIGGGARGAGLATKAALARNPTYLMNKAGLPTKFLGNLTGAGERAAALGGTPLGQATQMIGKGLTGGAVAGAKAGAKTGAKLALPSIVSQEAYTGYDQGLVEALDAGLSEDKAHAYATAVGSTAGAITFAFGAVPGLGSVTKNITEVMSGKFGASFKRLAGTMIGENAEEGLITMSQLGLQTAMSVDPNSLTEENIQEQLYQTFVRATMGAGLVGGPRTLLTETGNFMSFMEQMDRLKQEARFKPFLDEASTRLDKAVTTLKERWKDKPGSLKALEDATKQKDLPKPQRPTQNAGKQSRYPVQGDTVETVMQDAVLGEGQHALWTKLKGVLESQKRGMPLLLVEDIAKEADLGGGVKAPSAATYDLNAHAIRVDTKAFKESQISNVMLHELTHAATSYLVQLKAHGKEGVPASAVEAGNKLDSLLLEVKKHVPAGGEGTKAFYGTTNVLELVTEGFTNQNFQKFLSGIEIDNPSIKGKNLFEAFVEIVRELLGLDKNTALDEVIRLGSEIAESDLVAPVKEALPQTPSRADFKKAGFIGEEFREESFRKDYLEATQYLRSEQSTEMLEGALEGFSQKNLPNFGFTNIETGKPVSGQEFFGIPELKSVSFSDAVWLMEKMTTFRPLVDTIKSRKGYTTLGFFEEKQAELTGGITLNEMLNDETIPMEDREKLLVKVFSHELGHLMDYIDFDSLRRTEQGESMESLTERMAGLSALTSKETRNATLQEMRNQGLTDEAIKAELIELTESWNPYDKEAKQATVEGRKYIKYRESDVELWGEFISVLLASPERAKAWAPKTFDAFWTNINNRPDVAEKYLTLQRTLNGEPADVAKWRAENDLHMFGSAEVAWRLQNRRQEMEHEGIATALVNRQFDYVVKDIMQRRRWPIVKALLDYNSPVTKYRGAMLKKHGTDQVYLKFESDVNDYQRANNTARVLTTHIQDWQNRYREAGIADNDMNLWLYYTTVAYARDTAINPRGLSVSEAKEQIRQMEARMGKQLFDELENYGQDLRENVWEQEVLNPLLAQDYITEKEYDAMVENVFYSPILIQELLEDNRVSGKIEKTVGTLRNPHGSVLAHILKGSSLLVASETNKFKRQTVKILNDFGNENEIRKIGKDEALPHKMEKMTVKTGGKVETYAVSKEVNDMVNGPDISQISKMMSSAVYKVFYPLYITFRFGFLLRNVPRDLQRSWWLGKSFVAGVRKDRQDYLRQEHTNENGEWDEGWSEARVKEETKGIRINSYDIVKAFIDSLPAGIAAANENYMHPEVMQALRDKTWTMPWRKVEQRFTGRQNEELQEIIKRALGDNAKIEDLFKKDNPDFIKNMLQTKTDALKPNLEAFAEYMTTTRVGKAWDFTYGKLNRAIDATEAATKFSAARIAEKAGLNPTEAKELARTYMGTPNSRRRGASGDFLNGVSMFATTRLANLRSHYELISNPHSRGQYLGLGSAYLATQALMDIAIASGVLGAYMQDWWDMIPEEEKYRHWIIPLAPFMVLDDDGQYKALYFKIPKEHDAAAATAAMQITVDAFAKGDPRKMTEVVSQIGDQIIGTPSPPYEIIGRWWDYATGTLPLDSFFDTPIMRESTFRHGGYKAYSKMIGWTISKFGALGDPVINVMKLMDEGFTYENLPRLLPGTSSIATVSNRGILEDDYEAIREDRERGEAPTQMLTQNDTIEKLNTEYNRLLKKKRALDRSAGALDEREQKRFEQLKYYYKYVYQEGREQVKKHLGYAEQHRELEAHGLADKYEQIAQEEADLAGETAEAMRDYFAAQMREDKEDIQTTLDALLKVLNQED